MPIGSLTLSLYLPGINSLKAKRHVLKPMLARLHKEFNISVAEYAHQDIWQSSQIRMVMVCNDAHLLEGKLITIRKFIQIQWPDLQITDDTIEIIN